MEESIELMQFYREYWLTIAKFHIARTEPNNDCYYHLIDDAFNRAEAYAIEIEKAQHPPKDPK